MGHHEPVDVDPKALESAHGMWVNFTHLVTYSVLACVAILLLMALFLL